MINPTVLNRYGRPVAYKLVPGINATPFLDPEAPVAKRAEFMFKHFWATRYAPGELYPAGWFPISMPVARASAPGPGQIAISKTTI